MTDCFYCYFYLMIYQRLLCLLFKSPLNAPQACVSQRTVPSTRGGRLSVHRPLEAHRASSIERRTALNQRLTVLVKEAHPSVQPRIVVRKCYHESVVERQWVQNA